MKLKGNNMEFLKAKKLLVIILCTVFTGLTVHANAEQAQVLDAVQIQKLMAGNSISGIYEGKKFKQNNHADGIAVVYIAGEKVRNIHWIANDRDEYCENWGEWGWSCFKFSRSNGKKLSVVKQGNGNQPAISWDWHKGFIDINP